MRYAALKFFLLGIFDEEVNHTFIALIPKLKNLMKVSESRPISLCNVLYKIISKTLANRLKTILLDLISSNQSAFIPSSLFLTMCLRLTKQCIPCIPYVGAR